MEKARILVIEDLADLAVGLRDTLTALGYEVPAVLASGEEAVRVAADLRPDLVIMDIGLSGELDGVDAATRIRADHDVPVIYLTARSSEEILQRAKATEPYAFLLKPFPEQELVSAVELALHRHKLDRELRESTERFRLYYDKAPLAYQSLDRDGRLIAVNPAWLEMLGYSREDAVGRPFADLVSPCLLYTSPSPRDRS